MQFGPRSESPFWVGGWVGLTQDYKAHHCPPSNSLRTHPTIPPPRSASLYDTGECCPCQQDPWLNPSMLCSVISGLLGQQRGPFCFLSEKQGSYWFTGQQMDYVSSNHRGERRVSWRVKVAAFKIFYITFIMPLIDLLWFYKYKKITCLSYSGCHMLKQGSAHTPPIVQEPIGMPTPWKTLTGQIVWLDRPVGPAPELRHWPFKINLHEHLGWTTADKELHRPDAEFNIQGLKQHSNTDDPETCLLHLHTSEPPQLICWTVMMDFCWISVFYYVKMKKKIIIIKFRKFRFPVNFWHFKEVITNSQRLRQKVRWSVSFIKTL